ncbi:unnamed protein product [Owenia fusiformis]|uniref:Peroxisomal biogenesis factor 3 n=1 Tax=Owenia fusiformis TaxID=6347 RepID=A0A8J1UCR9_OWEFU|nr:unnamed protein product [Owenia fusiformis]
MLSSIWGFVKRHRRKFLFTGAVVGGVVLLGKYARSKIQQLQEKEAADCLAHARRQHHFDSNQRTCNMTVLSMMPNLRETLMKALDSEHLTEQLKARPANKLEIWEDLKITSFSRTLVSMYSVCMVVVYLRVQLNIIGGYMYLDNLLNRNGTTPELAVASPEIQQKYLANVQYLLGQGLTQLITDVTDIAKHTLENISLKEKLTFVQLKEVLQKVRHQMEYRRQNGYYDASATSLCKYILPEDIGHDEACSLSVEERTMNKLMRETTDMVESGDFHSVLTNCLDSSFIMIYQKLHDFYRETDDESIPLAKLIPMVNSLIHTTCGDSPNFFIQEILLMEQVKNFAANVYEAFSQVSKD